MKFMKICNLPGLKQTRGIKIQKLKRFGSKGVIIQTSTRLDDVPMGDTFSVDDCIILRSVNDGESIIVEVYLEIKYMKYTLLK